MQKATILIGVPNSGKNQHMVKVIKIMKENKEQIVNWIFENNYNYRIIETESDLVCN